MRKPLSRTLLVILFTFFLTLPGWCQYGAGLQGTITDNTGAVVAGAGVTATNQQTGVQYTTESTGAGFYRINGLPPGNYTVEVKAGNFRNYTSTDVVIASEQVRGLDIALSPGTATEVVQVVAENPQLQTENASIANTVSAREVVSLPEFGRDPYELIRLTPGIFADAARQGNGNSQPIPQQVGPGGSNSQIFQTENQVQAIAAGQRVSANTFALDGVSVNSLEWGGAAVVTPTQESIEEISISSSSYSAQDGRTSGAQVKVVSKSGSNVLHGSLFAKFNDKGLNAFNKFYGPNNIALSPITCETGTPSEFAIVASHCPSRVDQRYRDYAGSVGGPIFKNRLFFFFSYEGVRQSGTSLTRDAHLETPEFQQYVIQNNPDSTAAKIFKTPGMQPRIATTTSVTDCCSFIPNYGLGKWYVAGNQLGQAIGNGPDGIPDWGIFDITVPGSSRGDQYNGRIDYSSGSNQFFVSTYIVRLNQLGGGIRPIEDLTLTPHDYVGTVGWTRTIGSTMLNELRVNFTRFDFNQLQPVGTTDYGIPQVELFDFDIAAGGPAFDNAGTGGTLLGIPQNSTTPAALAQNTYGLSETFGIVRGQHALKIGTQISREQNNNNQPGTERPLYQFRGLLNFANDACCFFEGLGVDPTTGGPPNGQRYFRTADYAVFAQDDWKVRPNLTLNLGLRWEYFSPNTEAHGTLSNYIMGSQGVINGSVQRVNHLYNSDYNNFGPRIGFAWSPGSGQGNLVMRGGFGILFNRFAGITFDNVRQNTPLFAQASTCCFFDPGAITGPPPDSNILYTLGASNLANSYPANPALSFGVAPDGALCANVACDAVTKVDVFGALPNTRIPYVYVFSYEAQVEPFKDIVLKIGYQGSRSRKLVRTIDLNRFIPGDTFDGLQDKFQNSGSNGDDCGPTNPTCLAPRATGNNRFNRIFFPLPDVNASYDALVLHGSHRFSHGFQLDGNYTWSHAIDTASFEVGYQQTDPSNASLNRANSDFDVRQNFSLAALWESPTLRGRHGFLAALLGSWTLSGIVSKHTGYPFSALIGSCDTNNDRNGDGYCPDLPFAYFGGALTSPTKQQWINGIFPDPATEFDTTTRGEGCRCRNIFTGPGYTSIDAAVSKDFRIPHFAFFGEGSKLALRANFFNLFNILNLNPLIPATAPTDIQNTGGFGRPSDGLAGRVIEFQARLSF
jgi:hypothetical protein